MFPKTDGTVSIGDSDPLCVNNTLVRIIPNAQSTIFLILNKSLPDLLYKIKALEFLKIKRIIITKYKLGK